MSDPDPRALAKRAAEAHEMYGKLKEGAYFSGHTFERACKSLIWLLTERRWQLLGFGDVHAFLDTIQLDQLRLIAEQRKEIAALIKKETAASNRQIAKVLSVNRSTVDRDLDSGANAPPASEKTRRNNTADPMAGANAPLLSGAQASRVVDAAERKLAAAEDTARRRAASRSAPVLADGIELRIGDCRKVLADVPEASVPLILTDPPFGAEALYKWLADFAARALIPGGSLICYTGHSRLDRDMRILSAKLRYWWQLAMLHDQTQRFPGKFVIVGFRPVLWYVRDHRRGRTLVPDILKSPARDKELHNWGQGEGGVSALIEHLTEPGELIVDPFAGTATWGRIAAGMGRRWLGSDVVQGGAEVIEASPDDA